MKRLFVILVIFVLVSSNYSQKSPLINDLKQISQVPNEIPQRITGMTFDGKILWFPIYLDKGHYATFNIDEEKWKYSDNQKHHDAILKVAQPFNSYSGIAFVGKSLWLGGSYGENFGSINTETWEVEKNFTMKVRPDLTGSQSYSSFAFDGKYIWAAWHCLAFNLPNSETQQLLKIDIETGKILEKFPLIAGRTNDTVHGLTFDGKNLWHIKDKRLTKFDLNGQVLAQFNLKELYRPSGLAWDGESMWIVEFSGKLWKLPFR
ncbi:MAG: hypothetical protein MUC29_12425 [Pyrinomonadaceae bacterium]|jgi:hypothetical protein|nr:hypothetical protein [Pyrinomonadaceae bacterium]